MMFGNFSTVITGSRASPGPARAAKLFRAKWRAGWRPVDKKVEETLESAFRFGESATRESGVKGTRTALGPAIFGVVLLRDARGRPLHLFCPIDGNTFSEGG